jgi:hypothetical protein
MMNKKILNMVVVLVLLGSGSAFAPKAMANEIGLKAGYQYYEGIKAGLFYTVDLGDSFALQPEVYYSQRKFQYSSVTWYDIPGEKAYDTVRFIEVPVLLKYKFNLSGRFKPVLFAGGYAGFRVSRDFYASPVHFILSRYVQVDGGLVVGAGLSGFERGQGKIRLHIDLRWNIGLVDFQELTPYLIEILVPPEYNKNRSLSLMVGVSF